MSNLFALVGENNSGKSNVLIAVGAFLTGGAGGLKEQDFFDSDQAIIIRVTFDDLTEFERKRWKKYLVASQLIMEKRIWIEADEGGGASKIRSEYHGYEAQPAEWFLSVVRIQEQHGSRPNWKNIVDENGLPEYFVEEGKCTKAIFVKALERYLEENDVAYEEPDLSETQALGLQSKAVASLPAYYVLPAITDYSSEIDKRQKSSTFRQLMGELSERILKNDPRFHEVQEALDRVQGLLNRFTGEESGQRLEALETIERQIGSLLKELMPSVSSVKLAVQIEEIKELFSSGVALNVDDGVETDVLAKGHGLQRCIVFSLLRTLIDTQRSNSENGGSQQSQSIILGIEEPELYIHPQLSKLFYDVMRAFGASDQILYTTHSPLFVDAYNYQEVGMVRKQSVEEGTTITTVAPNVFSDMDERKVFQGLSRFNPAVNELFFAKSVLVVEGPEDLVAVTATLIKLGKVSVRAEELNCTILVAGGKPAIPFFQRVMNAFRLDYMVLHDTDIDDQTPQEKADVQRQLNDRITELAGSKAVHRFPYKLEKVVGMERHFRDQYHANQFFAEPANISAELERIVGEIFA